MESVKKKKTHRFNTRIFDHQRTFIKDMVKKSKGQMSEGDALREIINFYINSKNQ